EVYAGLAGELVYRPPYLGTHPRYDVSHRAALVFDFSKAWARRDYRRRIPSGSLATGSWKGRRDAAGGFNVVRHEGAGIELAFRPVLLPGRRGAEQLPQAEPEPGCVHRYRMNTRPAGGAMRAGWAIDFSVST